VLARASSNSAVSQFRVAALPMDCYLDVVGGLVPLRCEKGGSKAVRDKVAGKASSNITELKQFR
jgi:hypothetical protein